jgi:pilus assembly protein CpaD
MSINRTLLSVALGIPLMLGACAPVTSYSDSEAAKNLTVDTAASQIEVHFAPGWAQLSAAEAARLQHLAVTGAINRSDRVSVASTGTPALVEQRIASVAAVLLRYGIVTSAGQLSQVPPNAAIMLVSRGMITEPACPNWSKPSQADFSNQPSSNFGCSTETNLGLMVAYPSDLASARSSVGTAGEPATAAMHRYMTDKVELPTANTALPIPSANQPNQAANGNGNGSQ